MQFALDYFPIITIDRPAIVEAYAVMDAETRAFGRPLGKNDLWIAATTYYLGATLLTTDRDFDPLFPAYIQRDWIDPTIP